MTQYQLTPTKTNCPVCSSKEGLLLYAVSSAEAAQHFVRKEADKNRYDLLKSHIGKLWGQDSCEIIRCVNCNLCYAYPYVAGDGDFYTIAHPRSGYPSWKWEYQHTFDVLTAMVKRKELDDFKILEIGAGEGAFVKRIAPALTGKKNVVCTEYSDYGAAQIGKYGIQCHMKDVRVADFEQYRDHFNVLCMFQVLEHMDGLDDLFNRLNEISTSDAHMFIAVPNPKFIEFIEKNDATCDMPPNHIGRWSCSSFEVMTERFGWRVVSCRVDTSESIYNKARRFAIYRFLQESQKPNTLANRVERLSSRYLRYALLLLLSVFYGLGSLRSLVRSGSKDLGMAQWVHLRKGGPD